MNIADHVLLFEQEMDRRKFSIQTIQNYSSCLKKFFGQSIKDHPKNISESDIRLFLSTIKESNTQRAYHSAIKKFYEICLRQKDKFKFLPYAKKSNKTPIILDQSEIQKMFDVCSNEKHRCIMFVLYATGVRVSELLSIRLKYIDRANMVIYVMNGKGGKQRSLTMKPELLKIFESYYRAYKPNEYLFEGQSGGQYTASSIRQFLNMYGNKANIKKNIYPHLFRHCSLTHSLEAGENLHVIQKIAGHNSPITTSIYLHMSPKIIANAFSPIQNIRI